MYCNSEFRAYALIRQVIIIFFCLLEISVIHPAEYKLPSIREICICMLVYAYKKEVLKKDNNLSDECVSTKLRVAVHSLPFGLLRFVLRLCIFIH